MLLGTRNCDNRAMRPASDSGYEVRSFSCAAVVVAGWTPRTTRSTWYSAAVLEIFLTMSHGSHFESNTRNQIRLPGTTFPFRQQQ
jgi:hypothetical protein